MNSSDSRPSAQTLKAKIVKIVFCLVFSFTVSGSFLTSPTWATPGVFVASGALLSPPPIMSPHAIQSLDVELGDLDGDGDLDAFVPFIQNILLFLNNGSGVLVQNSPFTGLGRGIFEVALGDLDGDGDLDIFAVNGGFANNVSSTNQVMLNDGSGRFTITRGLGSSESRGVELGDVDGDGDLDAFVVNLGQPNRVYLNNGSGFFSGSGQALGNADSRSVSLGDVDGDGDLDAFVVNQSDQANRVYLNDGAGNFSDSGQALGSADSRGVELGDVDGDGDLDAFVVGGIITLYLNNGSGSFSDSGQSLLGKGLSSLGVELGDVDGDGDLDAVVANLRDSNQVFLNDGSGSFSDSGQALGVDGLSFAVALGDLNGDGFLDAVVANLDEPDIVYLNEGNDQPTLELDIAKAKVKLKSSKPDKDGFKLKGELFLSSASDGFDLDTEDLTLVFGDFSETIPAGSFERKQHKWKFKGSNGGIKKMDIRDTGRFEVKGKKLNLGGNDFLNPIVFSIEIGDDFGIKPIQFNGKLKFEADDDD